MRRLRDTTGAHGARSTQHQGTSQPLAASTIA
jgi:hypothetical protein